MASPSQKPAKLQYHYVSFGEPVGRANHQNVPKSGTIDRVVACRQESGVTQCVDAIRIFKKGGAALDQFVKCGVLGRRLPAKHVQACSDKRKIELDMWPTGMPRTSTGERADFDCGVLGREFRRTKCTPQDGVIMVQQKQLSKGVKKARALVQLFLGGKSSLGGAVEDAWCTTWSIKSDDSKVRSEYALKYKPDCFVIAGGLIIRTFDHKQVSKLLKRKDVHSRNRDLFFRKVTNIPLPPARK